MEATNPRYVLFSEGRDRINGLAIKNWPMPIGAVADLLGVSLQSFRLSRRHVKGSVLDHEAALQAWSWLCYSSRTPEMQRLLGMKESKIGLKYKARIELQEGLDRISKMERWPSTHRRLGLYLDVTYSILCRTAARLGMDVSRGFSREAAEKVWRQIHSDQNPDYSATGSTIGPA